VRFYLDILTGTFMVRQLQPWYENLSKRQVKAAKIYLRDSGLLHTLLGLFDFQTLHGHPGVGASWEGFAIEQTLQILRPSTAYFWATHSGAEVDLFFLQEGHRYGIEYKYNEAPKITKSMNQALNDLNLSHLWIIYPGKDAYPLSEQVSVWPIKELPVLLKQLR
jgi:uncharacterized protein